MAAVTAVPVTLSFTVAMALAKQPHPFDERPKINGELTIDQMHE
jgi:hypothetical protein